MKYSRYTIDGDSLDLEILVKALGLKSLHFGLWKKNQPVSIEEVSKAQQNYTVKLVGMFPKKVKKVLDVGAGVGDNAIYMAKKGYEVTSVSPSPSQENYFKNNILPKYKNINFIKSKYEDLEIKDKFDVILMSESCNYFPLKDGLNQTDKYLKECGHLIMGALLRKDNRKVFEEMNTYDNYVKSAEKKGLKLVKDIDVTSQVVQTMELTHSIYKYIPKISEVLVEFYKKSFSKKHWFISKILGIFFKDEIDIGKDILFEVGPRRTSPGPFLEYVTYRFLDFKKIDIGLEKDI